jgi:hypothetical protein
MNIKDEASLPLWIDFAKFIYNRDKSKIFEFLEKEKGLAFTKTKKSKGKLIPAPPPLPPVYKKKETPIKAPKKVKKEEVLAKAPRIPTRYKKKEVTAEAPTQKT